MSFANKILKIVNITASLVWVGCFFAQRKNNLAFALAEGWLVGWLITLTILSALNFLEKKFNISKKTFKFYLFFK